MTSQLTRTSGSAQDVLRLTKAVSGFSEQHFGNSFLGQRWEDGSACGLQPCGQPETGSWCAAEAFAGRKQGQTSGCSSKTATAVSASECPTRTFIASTHEPMSPLYVGALPSVRQSAVPDLPMFRPSGWKSSTEFSAVWLRPCRYCLQR